MLPLRLQGLVHERNALRAKFLLERRGVTRDLGAFVVAARFDRAGAHCGLRAGRRHAAAGRSRRSRDLARRSRCTTARCWRWRPTPRPRASSPAAMTARSAASRRRQRHRHRPLRHEMGGARRPAIRRRRARGCSPARSARWSTCSTRPGEKLKELHASVLGHRPRVRRQGQARRRRRTTTAPRCGSSRPRPTARACWNGRAATPAIAIHPDGDAVVTAMQENALHGWRLSDGQHMRMSGYPAKTQSLSFTPQRQVAGEQWRGCDGAVAVLRRRPDGQGAAGAGGRRRHHLHAGRLPSAAGDGRGRLRRRAGGDGGYRILARPADGAAGARAGLRAGLESGWIASGGGDRVPATRP